MKFSAAIIDTNIVVAALLTGNADSPTAKKDNHLWSLLQDQASSVLVTGDLALARNPPRNSTVLQPREFVTLLPE